MSKQYPAKHVPASIKSPFRTADIEKMRTIDFRY